MTVIPVTPVQSYPSRDISTLSGDLVRINKIVDQAKRPVPVLDSVTNLLCIMFYFPAALPALLPVFTVLYSCDLSKNACWLLLFGIKLFWRSNQDQNSSICTGTAMWECSRDIDHDFNGQLHDLHLVLSRTALLQHLELNNAARDARVVVAAVVSAATAEVAARMMLE